LALFQGMITRVLVALFFVLGGSLWLSIGTTRDYLQRQLNAYTQDSANSLALALQPHIAKGDLLAADTMIMALVQSGYYSGIELRDSRGDLLADHHLDSVQSQVPDVFTSLLPLHPPAATAAISSGWEQVASVAVSAHPELAYQQLWRLTQGILGLGLAGIALALAQTLHWSRHRQQWISAKLQSLNEEIGTWRREALEDGQTGLGNRQAFGRELQRILKAAGPNSTSGENHLLMIHLSSLAEVTRSLGRWAADEYLEAAIALLRRRFGERLQDMGTTEGATEAGLFHLFRTGDGELALLGNFGKRDAVCALAQDLCDGFSAQAADLHPHGFGCIGIVPLEATQTVQDMLASSDIALRQAERTGTNQWCYLPNGSPFPQMIASKLETSE